MPTVWFQKYKQLTMVEKWDFWLIFKHCERKDQKGRCAHGSFHVLGLGVLTSLLFNVFTRLQTKKFAKTESRLPKGNLETSFVYLFLLTLQVLFRYAIAIFKYMESVLLKQCDYMTIYNTLRDGLEYLTDMPTLTQVSLIVYTRLLDTLEYEQM